MKPEAPVTKQFIATPILAGAVRVGDAAIGRKLASKRLAPGSQAGYSHIA
jgi:hypothetical protein